MSGQAGADLGDPPPRKVPKRPAPQLDPYKATIRAWLIADLSAPRKQRHTARRIWQRLVDELGASVAESTVRKFVAHVRRELESETALVTVPQLHPPTARPASGCGARATRSPPGSPVGRSRCAWAVGA